MHFLLLDTEQKAILEEAATFADRILAARVERRDPDRIVSDSIKLQMRKIDHIKRQLNSQFMLDWQKISPAERSLVEAAMADFLAAPTEIEKKARWTLVVSIIIQGTQQSMQGMLPPSTK